MASTFITRLIDIILSDAKNVGSIATVLETRPHVPHLLRRSAQHDSAIVSCFPAVGLVLRSDRVFFQTWCVWVGKIRCILIWLIEHFSSTARISAVLLNQRRYEPDIFVR